MRQPIDTALLFVIGHVNRAIFSASRGRVVLYRFRGRPAVRVTVIGPDAPIGRTLTLGYLPDGDDCVLLAAETQTDLLDALRTATAVTADFARQEIPADLTMLTDDAERAALLRRLLKRASIDERHAVARRRELPIARLTPHRRPDPGEARSFVTVKPLS